MKYIVGYSGGIDSTYTAWHLKRQGHEVLLVNFINIHRTDTPNSVAALKSMANKLSLEIEIIDLSKEFKKIILDDFAENYIRGLTPNPCIKCNEFIKFAILEHTRQKHNFDKICTGHYADIIEYKKKKYISKPVDTDKDQTYMLYRLANDKNNILDKIYFPLANLTKKLIKEKIQNSKIPLLSDKESQNICFLDDNDYPRFIKQNYHTKIKKGAIIDLEGNYLGEHKGIIHYTIGQRQGLNLGSKSHRNYVLDLDYKNNRIIVGPEINLYYNELYLYQKFLIKNAINKSDFIKSKIYAKIRYRHKGGIIKNVNNKGRLLFKKKIRAITPGQHCVIYKKLPQNHIIIGGGIIKKSLGFN